MPPETTGPTVRYPFSELLSYRQFSPDDNLVYLPEGAGLAVGFGLALSPKGQSDAEAGAWQEDLFKACPPEGLIQFVELSDRPLAGFLEAWTHARWDQNPHPLLRELAYQRREFLYATSNERSMLPPTVDALYPRLSKTYCLVRLPYSGDGTSESERQAGCDAAVAVRHALVRTLQRGGIETAPLGASEYLFLEQQAEYLAAVEVSTLGSSRHWTGTPAGSGGPLLVSPQGQLACFDVLQTSTNYSFVLIGSSGSGKTHFLHEMTCDFLSKAGLVRLIDQGRSYQRFCGLMGGEYVALSNDNPLSLNPFSHLRNQQDLEEMRGLLNDLFYQLAFPQTTEEDLDHWRYAAIGHAITASWQDKRSDTELRDIYYWLDQHDDPRVREVAGQLEPYATGRYAPWFRGPRQLPLGNPLVVFDLVALQPDSPWKAAVATLVMYHATEEMYRADRSLPKMLALDETWALVGCLRSGKFVQSALRRLRMYRGCAGLLLQSFDEVGQFAVAKAFMENSAWQFVFQQPPSVLERAKANKLIGGDAATMELLKAVRSGPGFSEIYVRGEEGSGVYRFIPDRHSYYAFSTRQPDIACFNDLVGQGLTDFEALDLMARKDYETMWGSVEPGRV